ncbi:MAG: DUF6998 domain-containing protein [Methylomicrobium sp.]
MQLIKSLGEAMAWFERELQWGVPPTELRHLCGRIGELYCAHHKWTNSNNRNQKGYDVVSGQGEHISVKTTARMGDSGSVSFNSNSLSKVDRVIVLRVNTEEMQVETLLDSPIAEARKLMTPKGKDRHHLALSKLAKRSKPRSEIKTIHKFTYNGYTVRELESGFIEIEKESSTVSPVKPALRELAILLNVSLVNSNGNPFNTRQLGSQIIKSIGELRTNVAQHTVQAEGPASGCPAA